MNPEPSFVSPEQTSQPSGTKHSASMLASTLKLQALLFVHPSINSMSSKTSSSSKTEISSLISLIISSGVKFGFISVS